MHTDIKKRIYFRKRTENSYKYAKKNRKDAEMENIMKKKIISMVKDTCKQFYRFAAITFDNRII